MKHPRGKNRWPSNDETHNLRDEVVEDYLRLETQVMVKSSRIK